MMDGQLETGFQDRKNFETNEMVVQITTNVKIEYSHNHTANLPLIPPVCTHADISTADEPHPNTVCQHGAGLK